jgi:hypothetical protein
MAPDTQLMKLQRLQNKVLRTICSDWQSSKAHTGSRYAYGVQNYAGNKPKPVLKTDINGRRDPLR